MFTTDTFTEDIFHDEIVGFPEDGTSDPHDLSFHLQFKSKDFTSAITSSINQVPGQTMFYRYIGEDSLSSGHPDEWIEALSLNWIIHAPEDAELFLESLRHFDNLRDVLNRLRVGRIEDSFVIPDKNEVRRFLLEHPNLIETVIHSRHFICEHFGPVLHITLKVVRDPEMPGHEQLIAYVSADLNAEELLNCLDNFDDVWFVNQTEIIGDIYIVTIE